MLITPKSHADFSPELDSDNQLFVTFPFVCLEDVILYLLKPDCSHPNSQTGSPHSLSLSKEPQHPSSCPGHP